MNKNRPIGFVSLLRNQRTSPGGPPSASQAPSNFFRSRKPSEMCLGEGHAGCHPPSHPRKDVPGGRGCGACDNRTYPMRQNDRQNVCSHVPESSQPHVLLRDLDLPTAPTSSQPQGIRDAVFSQVLLQLRQRQAMLCTQHLVPSAGGSCWV